MAIQAPLRAAATARLRAAAHEVRAQPAATADLSPKPEPPKERIVVVAKADVRRQLTEKAGVAAAEDHVVRLERCDECCNRLVHELAPALLAVSLEAARADVLLVGLLPERQVPELHRFHDAFHDHRRAEPGAEAEEEHPPSLVAAEGLHGGVVDDLRRFAEPLLEVEAGPAGRQVDGIANDAPARHHSRHSDRDADRSP